MAWYLLEEVWNADCLEVALLKWLKFFISKATTINLKIDSIVFRLQCYILPTTIAIILRSEVLDIHSAVLNLGNYKILLNCANYILTVSLTYEPTQNKHLASIAILATKELLYKEYKKGVWNNIPLYAIVMQHHSGLLPLPFVYSALPATLNY